MSKPEKARKIISAQKVYAFIRYAAPGGGGCVEALLTKSQQDAMLAMRDFLLEELPTYEESEKQ
ncbi:hypothetical protein LCGC14_2083390 [marine sediment metagenome]|uniref:Uncharacterized protein n=1 Tax=marine sediment metagenome TaxID=412755 RepID=A0A0F9F255_9ZZZZ